MVRVRLELWLGRLGGLGLCGLGLRLGLGGLGLGGLGLGCDAKTKFSLCSSLK